MRGPKIYLNIPVSSFGNVFSWDKATIDKLVDHAVKLAVAVGLRLDEDEEGIYLKQAESRGAKIDRDARAVMFSEAQILEVMSVMRKTSPAPEPLSRPSISENDRPRIGLHVGNGANLLFDFDAWQPKSPTGSDLVEICQWAQGYDIIEGIFAPVMLKDIDLVLEPMYSYALTCKYCRKTVNHAQPTEPVHVKYLDKMSKVVETHRNYRQAMAEWEWINPPFRLSRRSIDTMLARIDMGICHAIGVGTMSASGVSAPVTVAGTAIVALAEILAGAAFFHILRPGIGLKGGTAAGALDMKRARVGYFGMHAHLINLAVWELMAQGIGCAGLCMSWYREANEPGMQAMYEYGMSQAFFSSVLARCAPEIGGLGCGNIFSPHQAVIDIELIQEFNELTSGFEVNPETWAIEEVKQARFEQGVHMATEHTLKHVQDGVPFSDFLFRGLAAGAQHDKNHTQTDELMEKAAQAVAAAEVKGRDTEPDDELGNELYEYVKEAAAELGLEVPPLL